MASKLSEGLSDQVTCAICLGHYSDPRLLPCLHTYCRKCLQDLLDRGKTKKSVTCPECREVVQIISGDASKLKVNFWINNILSLLALHLNEETQDGAKTRLTCENCDMNEKATRRCIDCCVFLCDFCSTAHQRSVATKGHQLVTLDELKDTGIPILEKQLFCTKHRGEVRKLFCKTCQELICRDCTIIDHRDHQFNFIEDVADQHKKIFDTEIKKANKVKSEVEEVLKSVQEMKMSVEKTSKTTEKDVDDFIDMKIRALEEKRVLLKEEIQRITAKKTKELATQEDELAMHIAGLKSAIEFTEKVLKNGGNSDILSISKEITSRFLQVCGKQFDKQPCEHDGIKLEQNSVDLTEHHDVKVLDVSPIPDPKQCFITQFNNGNIVPIQAPVYAVQGEVLTFIVNVKNALGKQLASMNDKIKVEVNPLELDYRQSEMLYTIPPDTFEIYVYSHEDGTYRFDFSLDDDDDILEAEIDVTIDGARVQGCPIQIRKRFCKTKANRLFQNRKITKRPPPRW